MRLIMDLLGNPLVTVPVVSWFLAQAAKLIINLFINKSIDLELLFASGGMPSAHSAFVSSLAVLTGLIEGFGSAYFALAFAFSCVVMYDAAGVRRAAGTHAAVINALLERLNIPIDEKLKEFIGHTPVQVLAGAVIGIIVSLSAYFILML